MTSLTNNTNITDPDCIEEGFPILCSICLGPNPLIRMTKIPYAKQCKICERGFTVYRWKPEGRNTRFKKTEICRTCAKLKNVCQTCILDINYQIPVQLRDNLLQAQNNVNLPQSKLSLGLAVEKYESQLNLNQSNDSAQLNNNYRNSIANNALIENFTYRNNNSEPYYKRNQQKPCSFFLKGNCNRGVNCPYSHEISTNDNNQFKLQKQNIEDRYFGKNDPVANKLLSNLQTNSNQVTPNNMDNCSLFLNYANLDFSSPLSTEELSAVFSVYGPIQSINFLPNHSAAFINYISSSSASLALEGLSGKLHFRNSPEIPSLQYAKQKSKNSSSKHNNTIHKSIQPEIHLKHHILAPPGIRLTKPN